MIRFRRLYVATTTLTRVESVGDGSGDADACLVVVASDVVLRGNGHLVEGAGKTGKGRVNYGVYASAEPFERGEGGHDDAETISNVTVSNLVVRRWNHGVHFEGVSDGRVVGTTVEDNRVGLYAADASGLVVEDGEFLDGGQHGIRLKSATDVTVRESRFEGQSARGVHATESSAVVVRDNDFVDNGEGVSVQSGSDNAVEANAFAGNDYGVSLSSTSTTAVTDNALTGGLVAIQIEGVHDHDETESDDDHADAGGPYGKDEHGPSDGGSDDHTHDDGDSDDHTHDDGDSDDHTHDDGDSDDHTHDDGDSDDHTHDDGDDHTHDDGAVGGNLVAGNEIADAAVAGVRLSGAVDATIRDNVVDGAATWAYVDEASVAPTTVDRFVVDGSEISFTGRAVAIGPAESIGGPDDYAAVGSPLRVEFADASSRLSIDLPYDAVTLPHGAVDADVSLWRFDGRTWAPDPPLVWRYVPESGWARDAATRVDSAAGIVVADVTGSGVVVPLARAGESGSYGSLGVTNATLSATDVRQGEQVTASANVTSGLANPARVVLELLVNGEAVRSETVDVDSGETRSVAFELRPASAGELEIAVSGAPIGTLHVREDAAPTASAGDDRTTKIGRPLAFDASESVDDVGVVGYEWDFGDGAVVEGVTASHAFERSGTYDVTLTVTDAAGNAATDTAVVTVERRSRNRLPNGADDADRGSVDRARPVVTTRPDGRVAVLAREARAGVPTTIDFGGVFGDHPSGIDLRSLGVTWSADGDYDAEVATGAVPADDVDPVDGTADETVGYVVVDHDFGDEAVAGAKVTFRLPRRTLTDGGVDRGNVALYRYRDGAWTKLPTEYLGTVGAQEEFRAESPGFSTFAVVIEGRSPVELVATLPEREVYDVGERFEVGAVVANTGSAATGYPISLLVNGEIVATSTRTLTPGDETLVRFAHAIDEPGAYDLAVNDVFVGTVTIGASDELVDGDDPTTGRESTEPESADARPGDPGTAASDPDADRATPTSGHHVLGLVGFVVLLALGRILLRRH
jgi:PKD repeat protein